MSGRHSHEGRLTGGEGGQPVTLAGGASNIQPAELTVLVTVEAIKSKAQENTTESVSEDEAFSRISNEQFLHIVIPAPDIQQSPKHHGKTHIIVVADNSGSMSGNPWKQVQMAVAHMKEKQGQSGSNTEMDLILYNSRADIIHLRENFKETIQNLKTTGMTNFVNVFDLVKSLVKPNARGEVFTSEDTEVKRTIIMFLTDGQDTVNSTGALVNGSESMKTYFSSMCHPVTVHVVGFSRSHDLKLLTSLQHCGNEPGMYRYCEPCDGPEALLQKLTQLFDYAVIADPEISLLVTLSSEGQMISQGSADRSVTLECQVVDKQDKQTETSQDNTTTGDKLVLEAEGWMYLSDPQSLPEVSIKLQLPGQKESIPVGVSNICRRLMISDWDRVLWSVRILSLSADRLSYKFSESLGQGKDLSKLEDRLGQLQRRISNIQVYKKDITSEYREGLFTHIKEIQTKVDKMHSMMAQYKRGEGGSVGFMARVNDLRYEATFSKNRRQRLMNLRVSRNASLVSGTQAGLDSLIVDPTHLKQLSQDALDFFFCVLSQDHVKDILEGSDKGNVIGFGLAIKRPEHVLDEPTALNVCLISGTLVSRSSMMDAIEHKLKLTGHLSTHGGFNFENELGVATVGTSREPINAWLPLYICEPHWQRVKFLLRPILGYLCTLDPLGYDNKQVDVLFMTLGCMIGQLKPDSVGQHQLQLLFAYHRLCAATAKEFDLEKQMVSLVEKFVASPQGRTKDIVPSLYTLVGYIVCLPHEETRRIFQVKENGLGLVCKFWLGFIAECVRRGARNAFRDTSEGVVDGIIDQILHGTGQGILSDSKMEEVEPPISSRTAALLQSLNHVTDDQLVLDIPVFDPAAGITAPKVTVKHSVKVDKAMDLWARAKCGIVKNKNQAEKVRDACKVVDKWLEEGNTMVGRGRKNAVEKDQEVQEEEQSKAALDMNYVTQSMIDTITKVLRKIEKHMFPTLSAIPGCSAFIEWWLTQQPDWKELDDNSGLAPGGWIEAVKQLISDVHGTITTTSETSDPDTVVTLVENPGVAVGEDAGNSGTDVSAEPQAASVVEASSKGNDDNQSESDNTDDGALSDLDDLYDDYVSDDDFEIDHPVGVSKNPDYINLPGLLCLCDSGLDVVSYTRGIVCQALHFNINAKARAGASGTSPGVQLLDIGSGMESIVSTLVSLQESLMKRRSGAIEKLCDEALWKRSNHCMLHSTTIWAFIGYLMNTYKDRGEGFSSLVVMILDPDMARVVPCLEEKLHVMLFGKYADCDVLALGNIWLPEKKTRDQLEEVLGEEAWTAMEIDLRSNVKIHVYRESDIPNRHGHCNSNPYIPNELRKKLGMPLMTIFKARARRGIYSKLALK